MSDKKKSDKIRRIVMTVSGVSASGVAVGFLIIPLSVWILSRFWLTGCGILLLLVMVLFILFSVFFYSSLY